MRKQARRRQWVLTLAELAGKTVRWAAVHAPSKLPGIVGAAAVAYGAGCIYAPLLFIVGGVFLLLLDRRLS